MVSQEIFQKHVTYQSKRSLMCIIAVKSRLNWMFYLFCISNLSWNCKKTCTKNFLKKHSILSTGMGSTWKSLSKSRRHTKLHWVWLIWSSAVLTELCFAVAATKVLETLQCFGSCWAFLGSKEVLSLFHTTNILIQGGWGPLQVRVSACHWCYLYKQQVWGLVTQKSTGFQS